MFLVIPFDVIDEEDSDRLEGKFTENEVSTTILGINGEKTSGPHGFPIVFWSFSWGVCKG